MPIYNLYSKRKQDLESSGQTDVFQYENIPGPLRVQIRKILSDGLGASYRSYAGSLHKNSAYQSICDIICREYGLDDLGKKTYAYDNLMAFIDSCTTEQILDVVELGCAMIDGPIRSQHDVTRSQWQRSSEPDELLDELNYRFQRAGVGYRFEQGRVIRVDSKYIHAEATKPALTLLGVAGYEGPQEEFLTAHEHLRNGRNKEAITEAGKSFESLMKAVCDRKGWSYPKGARASDLLKVLRRNHLWPDYLDGSFDQLLATLASGLPQVRNDGGAHGQGATKKEVPAYVASYALHLAASKMVLIAEAASTIADATPEAIPHQK